MLIPPPVLLLLVAILMWAGAGVFDAWTYTIPLQRLVAVFLTLLAALLMAAAVTAFLRAGTTINPMTPGRTTRLLTSGIYGVSRNPIYLADALLLAALAVWLGNPLNAILLAVFVAYIDWFQIRPEEAALMQRFGDEYSAYCARVRRWL